MRILIIGGAGYIGGVTAHIAIERGHEVVIFDDLSSGLTTNLPSSAQFIQGNVTDQADVSRIFENNATYDIVMHFAAKILVPESMEQPYEYLHVNSFGLLNVVDAASKQGIKNYILSSSAAVYGISKEFPITEDSLKQPVNPYGESKLIAEHVLASYQESTDLNWLAFRYFNVAGAYANVGPDYPFISHLIPTLLDRAYKKVPFTINGSDYDTDDGTCVRDFVHVADIGRAHVIAAEKMVNDDTRFNTAINLGSAEGYSVQQIVDQFRSTTGKHLEILHSQRRPGDPSKLVASNKRAKELLNWRPELELDVIIRDHSEWYDSLPSMARVKNLA
jgi:UDP-glucose 4-epimerase